MRGIAIGLGALVRSGEIPVGTKLPPVRDLAWALGVSPATVSAAWQELRQYRVISGRGRHGMWVSGDTATPHPHRFAELGNLGHGAIDLSMAVPDPALLPPLAEALSHGAEAEELNSYRRVPILDGLERAILPSWPYPAEGFIATNGGFEAVHITLRALIMPGSVVAIEDPTAMRLLDIVEHAKAHIVPVACDAEGPRIDALKQTLAKRPSVFLFQPRTHSVTGGGVSPERLREMVRVLEGSDTLVIEDDGIGDLSARPPLSLGAMLPHRTVHIRSYSKSLGPDMRLAVLSGPKAIVDRIQAYRNFGAGWTSRILQGAAAWLIADPATDALVAQARAVYAARRRALITALAYRGVDLPDLDGLCLCMPVRSEQYAMVTLAARKISVVPGSKFQVIPGDLIRVATGCLTQDVEMVADALALVAAGQPAAIGEQSPY